MKTSAAFWTACALLALSLVNIATALEPKQVATVEGITEYQFDNGLKLLLYPDASKPTVTVNMTVLVGSRHEGYGEGGMAHLLEHMVFKGTPTHPDVPKALRDRGASFNGTTNSDRTNYFETLPASDDNLEFAIRFEADRLVNSHIRREDLLSEFSVVRNEFERSENSPQNLLGNRMMAAAFDWHNYGKTTIGNRSDIERVPIENLQDFYKRYYQPDNVVVIVAGKFDEAKALKFTQQYFGAIPRPTRKLNNTYTEEPPQDGERKVELRRVGDVGIVAIAWHTPAAAHEDSAPLRILGNILSTQPTGRLYKALVDAKLATSVFAGPDVRHDPCVFDVQAEVRRDQSHDIARDTIFKVIDEVIASGVKEEEVERAKRTYANGLRRLLGDTSQFAISLSTYAATGDWRLYFVYRDRLEKVTPADVQRVAAKYLVPSNRTVGYFIPADKSDPVTVPSTPEIQSLVNGYKGRPPVAEVPEFEYTYPNIEAHTKRLTLPSGIKAAYLSKPTRDEKVELELTLRYGNAENLREFREARNFLPGLMTRGTKQLTYQQLRDEMTKLDVSINGFGNTFSVRARRGTLLAALDLLRQILREPTLDEKELAKAVAQAVAREESSRTDPSSLAGILLARTRSPYPDGDIRKRLTADESIALTKAVSIEQVRKLYHEYLGARDGELAIVGDFDPEPALAKINEMLADWKPKMPYARIEQQAFMDVPGGKQSIQTPDKANANYLAAITLAMNDQHPDYPALLLGNYIFGGGSLSSRLGDRVRQKEGLSYGVSSGFIASAEDNVSSLAINAICNPGNIGKVETAIREEFERLLKDGIPTEEFEKARQGMLKSRELNRSNDNSLLSGLSSGARYNRTFVYNAEIDAKLASLTPEEVHAALKKHLTPSRLIIVVAGDFEKAAADK
jgi:zinc protease